MRRILLVLLLSVSLIACDTDSTSDTSSEPAALMAEPVAFEPTEAGRPPKSALASEQVVHRGNAEEPQTLDPHLAQGVPAMTILRDLFEGLTTTEPNGRIVPGSAAHWDISRDGLVYTFYLDPDSRWSNGEPLTAQDFVWSWKRVVDPATAASYGRMLVPVKNAGAILAGEMAVDSLGVEALSDSSFQVTLEAPTPYFLGLLAHPTTYPVHRPSLEAHGAAHVRPGQLVSNGAYSLSDWQVRASIDLVGNPHYRRAGEVIVERVVYYPFDDEGTEFNRFRAGDLHWTYQVPSNRFGWLQDNMSEALQVAPWFGTYFFGFNLQQPPFQDNLALRQALNLAVDREILTSRVTRFGEIPTYNLIPPGLPDYTPFVPEQAEWTQGEREAASQRLYAEAGYSRDNPLTVELRYNSSENHRRVAVAVAAMWKQVLGVQTRLINEEFRVFLQNRTMGRVTEAFRAGWIGDYQDAFTFLELFHSQHARNDTGYANPRYDLLLEQIAAERISALRRNLMIEAERMLLADQVILPTFVYVSKRLVNPRLKGWQDNVMDHHLTRHMYLLRSIESTVPDAHTGQTEDG